jgi:hypothetical protein
MTKQFKLGTLAFAVATVCAGPAFAQTENGTTVDLGFGYNFDQSVEINLDNNAEVILQKKSRVAKSVDIDGKIAVTGAIYVNAAALSVTDNKQIMGGNQIHNERVDNTAKVDTGAAGGATGAVQVNVVAGDMNLQDNATALSAADLATVTGSADAEAFVLQMAVGNSADQTYIDNTASASGAAFNGASGVLNLNVTAGNFNMQKNNTAISVSTGRMAESTVWVKQEVALAETWNTGAAGSPATSSPTYDDFGQVNGTEVTPAKPANPVNNLAHLADAFVGASGAIGINISAGTNNLQSNSLTASATSSTGFGL